MVRLGGGLLVVGALCAIATPGCHWTADTSSGANSVIRVEGGQAVRGSIADPTSASPATAVIFPRNPIIFPGVTNKSIKGIVGPGANRVALGVAGDVDYWQVPALEPVSNDPESFNFAFGLSISRDVWSSPLLQVGSDGSATLPLSVRGVDNAGNFGEATIQSLFLDPSTITGTLAVTLQWDTPTDLDLHVLVVPANSDAGQVEVWSKARSASPHPDSGAPDGTLDFDSNANCQIDNRDQEDVVWTGAPPVGHYVVRVAAASLCGQTSAAWWAYASVPGTSKGEASGVLTQAATRSGEAAGAGVTVFEFDYP